MPSLDDLPFPLSWLRSTVESWIETQRDRYRRVGRPLDADEFTRLTPYFAAATLDRARIVEAKQQHDWQVPSTLVLSGFSLFGDLAKIDAITFGDAIVSTKAHLPGSGSWYGLLFHELVHSVQYEQLGTGEFLRRYMAEWASNGMRYRDIPLEKHAYELQRKFAAGEPVFSVEDSVGRWLVGEN